MCIRDSVDVVIIYKSWVWVATTSLTGLFPSRRGAPHEKGKAQGGVACGLRVYKMADATLSSEDQEIENPIETAVSRGALLHLRSNFL